MVTKWNVAILQMDVVHGSPAQNRHKIAQLVDSIEQSKRSIDVLLLPELWDTSYDLKRLDEIADTQEAQQFLAETAKRLNCFVIGGSVAEQREDQVYNTTYVFDRNGHLVGDYSKVHLFRLMNEDQYLGAGEKAGLYELEDQQVGSVICYDIRFPEWIRTYALKGAKVLFVPAQWPNPRLNHWRQLLIARAIENQMYVVACNRVGVEGKSSFFGHSLVIDPWGEVIAEGSDQEEILYAQLDLSLVDKVRGRIPVFHDRRTSLYEL
ncbi:carbon-nitrogen family hydrolase [Brevibacillus ginsengisoli]|uniref:carbon-nitrogen family hydrolase n=1 Tax=Brevibacillus ginsengisoli TaxID=363854 RepID=UPI003CEB9F6F